MNLRSIQPTQLSWHLLGRLLPYQRQVRSDSCRWVCPLLATPPVMNPLEELHPPRAAAMPPRPLHPPPILASDSANYSGLH
jgi:hypothetical protein